MTEPALLHSTGAYAVDDSDLPPDRFLDRELSWLQFNQRVLDLAADESVPLLERARFLAIFASNLDEFYMVRVAGLKRRIATGLAVRAPSGMQPREVLSAIAAKTAQLTRRQAEIFHDSLMPELEKHGIAIRRWKELTDEEQDELHILFRERIFPVLTPLAVDPAHPFPYISGLSLNLAVIVRNPTTGQEHFARVKVPPLLPRFTAASESRFVPLEDVIAAHLHLLFPGMQVLQHYTFRVTRNEDLEVDEDEAENLLQALERELIRRRFGPPVRLEVEESIDPHLLDLLKSELGVADDDVFALPFPLDLTGLHAIADVDRPELKFRPFVPGTHRDLVDVEAREASIFATLRRGDILVQHPYDSFATSVQTFIEQAAADRNVLAIKQTLYRTSGDSPIVDALIDAAEAGKQVLVLVEIKARFDEQANIKWARQLEQAGCHVVYGLVGLKTHCKAALVIRQEGDRLRRYAHIGTGNYNPKTARLYEDFGLFTASDEVGEDLTNLFNTLSGFSLGVGYKRLLVAPEDVRDGIIARVEQQAELARAGHRARVRIKVNSMVDEQIIDSLYRADLDGVETDLWVRGICAVRPGVPGLSERIRVRSILGRFLEHSRVFEFGVPGSADGSEVWIGSADMMHRNLDRRVEALVRIVEPSQVEELAHLLDLGFDEGTASWHLGPDGGWTRHAVDANGNPLLDLQEHLIAVKRRRAPATRV